MSEKMKWYVDISRIQGALLEQAKVEALRKIAELIEEQNTILTGMRRDGVLPR